MRNLSKLVTVIIFGTAGLAVAQNPTPSKALSTSVGMVVFPAKGQSAQQQSKDEGECYSWSKTQTGFDPISPATVSSSALSSQSAAQPPSGHRVRGALHGAAAGAVIGEVADDDAGKGAEIGAAVGVLKGGAERRRQQAQAHQQAVQHEQQITQDQQAAKQQQASLFNKGFSACLESKGYTVK